MGCCLPCVNIRSTGGRRTRVLTIAKTFAGNVNDSYCAPSRMERPSVQALSRNTDSVLEIAKAFAQKPKAAKTKESPRRDKGNNSHSWLKRPSIVTKSQPASGSQDGAEKDNALIFA